MCRSLEKNDVLMEDGDCLTDIELTSAVRASNILGTYQLKESISRQTATMGFPRSWNLASKTWGFSGTFDRISEQLVDSYKMRLMEITPVGEYQIHMIVIEELSKKEGTAKKESEVGIIEHFIDIIGIIEEGLIALLVKKWSTIMII